MDLSLNSRPVGSVGPRNSHPDRYPVPPKNLIHTHPSMLVLSNLTNLLSQILSLPALHTAFTFVSEPIRPKDEVRIIVGLSGEVWQETREQGYGMVDSELGRIVVVPVEDTAEDPLPLMLIALNSNESMEWTELQAKGKLVASHLARSLSKYREFLVVRKPSTPPTTSAIASPAPVRT
ncbi:uncharacterized protein EV420DRAFT_1511168 [Desarmillaria tabescens]|uniref:Uncharacterized protein n=1 Tax=Armillaria tabescens TaxID=1929756 RepID=A0AA39NIN0_ARMTA|nr:uncharacterized protein EV420DRAFT_1511168 [Desarmillaria tabescens]KAK0466344.1 hypothetical protein EV420DRAFT_1511168 [Desarmillaria tabescens]